MGTNRTVMMVRTYSSWFVRKSVRLRCSCSSPLVFSNRVCPSYRRLAHWSSMSYNIPRWWHNNFCVQKFCVEKKFVLKKKTLLKFFFVLKYAILCVFSCT